MKYEMVKIDPQKASELLSKNTQNYRRINRETVDKYATDMINGKWEDTGVPIVMDNWGILKDGQHRLMAIIRSGVTLEMLLITDVDHHVNMYDVGSKRSNQQILKASGFKKELTETYIVSAIRMIDAESFKPQRVSPATIQTYLEADIRMWETVSDVISYGGKKVARRGPVACGVYLMLHSGYSPTLAKEFCRVVNTGFPCELRDSSGPIYLRNYLVFDAVNKGDSDTNRFLFCATVRAMADFANNRKRKRQYTVEKTIDTEFRNAITKVKMKLFGNKEGK